MSGKAPRCSRHRAKRYSKRPAITMRNKNRRIQREWRRARKNPKNAFAKKCQPVLRTHL